MKSPASNIQVVGRCPLRWSPLRGDEQQHYCQLCRVSVQNLSMQSAAQRADLAAKVSHGEYTCVAYYQRPDGSLLVRPRWWPLWVWRLWWQLVSRFGHRKLPLGLRRRLGQPVMGRAYVPPKPPPRA